MLSWCLCVLLIQRVVVKNHTILDPSRNGSGTNLHTKHDVSSSGILYTGSQSEALQPFALLLDTRCVYSDLHHNTGQPDPGS